MTSTALTCDHIDNNPAETLGYRIVDLCTRINLATYQLLLLIAEFERHHYGEQQGFLSTANWLNYQCGIGLVAAREKVRVALALECLPLVATAFREGRLSYSKVRAITRVATVDNEVALLDIARHATASQAERIFRQYRQTLDSAESSGSVEAKNAFNWHWDAAGNLVFHGVLSPEQGAVVLAAVQQAKDAGADQADALAVVAQSALFAKSANSVNPASDAPREAGAAGTNTNTNTNTNTSTNISTNTSSAERYQIHVELDHHTQHIRNGPSITDKIIEHLSCDASILTHRSDAQGEPLNVGRKTRTIPPAIRRALVKRDQGCRFPGCTHQRFVDAHHIQHWAHGGETKLSNLVMLCSAHHKRIHESGFRISLDTKAQGGMQLRFFDPGGQEIRPIERPAIQGQVIPLFENVAASAESALAPVSAMRWPDYQHINWVLTNFHPPHWNNAS